MLVTPLNPPYSEADVCEKLISPALAQAGWDAQTQWLREFPLRAGRVVVRGRKASRDASTVLHADYVLFYKENIPLAVIEAKKSVKDAKAGMQQAIEYAALLDVPFCFSSNGQSFVFRDATAQASALESNLAMDAFPSPEQLWQKLCAHKGWSHEAAAVNAQPYQSDKKPRYYQLTAINRTVEAHQQRAKPRAPRHGHGHWQDLHRLPNHLALVEKRRKKAHFVFG